MRTVFVVAMTAILALSLTPASAATKKKPTQVTTTGQASNMGEKRGANDPRFCPPGQRKKPGKGSAFKC